MREKTIKHILLVGSFPNAQRKYSLHYRTTLVSCVEELKFGIEGIKLSDQVLIHDLSKLSELINKVEALHQVDPFDGVLSFSDQGLIPAATIADYLNIPGIELKSVQKTCNKYIMRRSLDANPRINVPYSLCKNPQEVREFFEQVNSSIVLKPLIGFGSRGVILVNSPDEIDNAFQYSISESEARILAEKYINGIEFSVESFTYKGDHEILAVTDKSNTGPPHFVGTFHSLPSVTPIELQEKIQEAVKDFLNCVGLTFGPAHTEVTVTEDGVKIIESQIRPGGRIYHMLEGALGIDIFEMTVKKLFDENYVPKDGKGGAAIYFIQSEPGTVKEILGVEEVHRDRSVFDFSIRCKVGDKVEVWKNSSHRLGHVICTGATTEEAIEAAKKLGSKIKIITSRS
ncbi:ATP-grasp domain-containing protein [Effusibacillus pohliae]|uniref:ATP-grasp domain-containing protein n=1 Tax=Effusibacillus pohliae TaxID=232270 RepID=UPI000477D699|nr:ATP-grasp domain-containing protein [Effusibacillus pohliae]